MTRRFAHGPLDFRAMSPVIKGLIIANVVVFLLLELTSRAHFSQFFGLVPYRVLHQGLLWQPFTYLFLHGGFFHLFFNVFALWMFGMPVEAEWGPREFLKFYFICGVGAGVLNVILTPHSVAPIIGASGAVYGLLIAFAMLFPDAVIYLYFLFPIKAKHMAVLFVVLEFMAATSTNNTTVARFAHLGGALIAYVYIRWWNWARMYGTALLREIFSRSGYKGKAGARRKTSARIAPPRRKPEPAMNYVDEIAEVDRILDKISDHGEESLTPQERETLLRQAKKKPEGHA
ncbi:MAG: rhomboid family intramembrane serine protease [Elusimicrobiota bacterium]